AYVHAYARQYDEAIVVCKKVASENPTFAQAHYWLAYAFWAKLCTRRSLKNGRPTANFPATETNLNSLLPCAIMKTLGRLTPVEGRQRPNASFAPQSVGRRVAQVGTQARIRWGSAVARLSWKRQALFHQQHRRARQWQLLCLPRQYLR